jgi:hypothetical protein
MTPTQFYAHYNARSSQAIKIKPNTQAEINCAVAPTRMTGGSSTSVTFAN